MSTPADHSMTELIRSGNVTHHIMRDRFDEEFLVSREEWDRARLSKSGLVFTTLSVRVTDSFPSCTSLHTEKSEDDKRGKRMRNSSVAKKELIQLTTVQAIIKKRWGHCTCMWACVCRFAHSLFQYVQNMINGLEKYWQWVSFNVVRLPWQQMTLPRGGLALSFGLNSLLTLFFSVLFFFVRSCLILSFILVFLRL